MKKKQEVIPKDNNIITESFEEQMKKSYIDYAMSVIVTRALPDVRDGLKPVQRRVLYDMDNLSIDYNKPHKKSARIVGDAMGRFHPHGDSSIYGSLVHMSQEWIYNHPLVNKHGNMGSIEGDGAAAMRYCVTGDTLINTNNGLQRISDIVETTDLNSDNPIDISVKSMNGKINKADMLFNSSYHNIFRIVLKNGMEIRVSGNHPVLIEENNKRKWVVAAKLKQGMNCVIDTCASNAMYGENNNLEEAQSLAKQLKKNPPKNGIPSQILCGTKMYLITFIKSLFGEKMKLVTSNKQFAVELQILLATQLGFLSKMICNPKENKYIIIIAKENEEYSLSEVRYVERMKTKEIVYSVRVLSNCHSFSGNGFINHNTEARLSKITQDVLLSDLDKDTVDFVPNYDDNEKEPEVLPAKIPNLLISGSEGIAVGMACSIPSHNLGETIDAVKLLLTKKNVKLEDVLEIIKGPDFATGGLISNKKDLYEMYKTGKGKIRIRGKTEIIERNGKPCIKITEIPATMVGSINKFIDDIYALIRDKKAPDIVNVSNLSNKEGIQIFVELKKGANAEKNLNILYKKAKLEDTFSFNMLAVDNKEPKIFSLIDYLQRFIDFQLEINTRKYNYLLEKETKEKEIKEGLVKAIDCIDLIVEILRGSKNKKDAVNCLMNGIIDNINFKTKKSEKEASKLKFTESQTNEILSMPLQRLIGLELDAILKDLDKCKKNIEEYQGYLNSPVKMKNRIKSDLDAIKKQYAIPRKTIISDEKEIVLEKESIVEEQYYLLVDRFRYAKLIDVPTFERNKDSISTDFKYCISIKNTDKLLLFTDKGKCHQIKVLTIPLGKYKDRGTPLENLSNLTSAENIVYMNSNEFISNNKFIFTNTQGYVKIVKGNEFISSTKTVVATKLPEDVNLFSVNEIKEGLDEIILITKDGYYLRFKISEISEMKKTSVGVRGIKLKDGDYIEKIYIGNSKSLFNDDIPFTRVKLAKRDGVGNKLKILS